MSGGLLARMAALLLLVGSGCALAVPPEPAPKAPAASARHRVVPTLSDNFAAGHQLTDWFSEAASLGGDERLALKLDVAHLNPDKLGFQAYGMALAARLAYSEDSGRSFFLRAGSAWLHPEEQNSPGSLDTVTALIGVGIGYSTSKKLSVHAGYDYYLNSLDARDNRTGASVDDGYLYAGFNYRFGGSAR